VPKGFPLPDVCWASGKWLPTGWKKSWSDLLMFKMWLRYRLWIGGLIFVSVCLLGALIFRGKLYKVAHDFVASKKKGA